jgi:hypothetical protein
MERASGSRRRYLSGVIAEPGQVTTSRPHSQWIILALFGVDSADGFSEPALFVLLSPSERRAGL